MNGEAITEKTLDAAGIEHWRERLADARRDDEQHDTGRSSWDLAWSSIKDELRTAGIAEPEPRLS